MSDTKGDNTLPLSGITVVDFSRLLPGPWCTRMLGEFGANVIKVEQPGIGDYSRHNHPRYAVDSVYYNAVNCDKRSLTLDLTKPEGQEIGQRLLKSADAVVESFRPGVTRKLKIDYDMAKTLNERLVYCSISGFGQTGPHSNIAGHDLVIQAMAGILRGDEDPTELPPNPGFQTADYAGALYAVIGVMAGIMQRDKTGHGCFLDVGMFDTVFNMCQVVMTSAMAREAGFSGEPRQEALGNNPRYANYWTKDGQVVSVALLEAKAWENFAREVGRTDLIDPDETFEHRLSAHGDRGDMYRGFLASYCASKTLAEHEEFLHRTGIAICPVYSPEQAMKTANVQARKLLEYIDSPHEGRIPHLVNPLSRDGLGRTVHRPAPALGEQTSDILVELGYSAADIASLQDAGIV
jgi:crotonobetainyl-CoA:carnitine CoA-transferase CaiB-like acyl-CoA transferase